MAFGFKRGIPQLPPPTVPSGKTVSIPNMPDWAPTPEFDRSDGPIVPFHQSVFLEYCGAGGEGSSRRITTRSLRRWNGDDLAIWAWCHERGEPRTFLASRVDMLTDAVTGEIYVPPADWLRGIYEEWPEVKDELALIRVLQDKATAERQEIMEAREQLAQEKRDAADRLRFARAAVLALVYVAKADGRMDADERAVIASFVRKLAIDCGVDLNWTDIHARLRKLYCDQNEFLDGLKRLRAGPADLRALLVAAANDLMIADGEINPREQRAVAWLKTMLKM